MQVKQVKNESRNPEASGATVTKEHGYTSNKVDKEDSEKRMETSEKMNETGGSRSRILGGNCLEATRSGKYASYIDWCSGRKIHYIETRANLR